MTETLTPRLQTDSILRPREYWHGRRFSIMSRHTLNDGVTPNDQIIEGVSYDEWWKELAPPDNLVGDWYKRREVLNLTWEKFADRYYDFLQNPIQRAKVIELIELALNERITVLCVEDTPEECHRSLLVKECQTLNPDLKTVIK